jgi:hypothetical protein
VIPRSLNGSEMAINKVKACADCNGRKGALLLWEWETRLLNPSYQTLFGFTPDWVKLIPVIVKNIRRHPLYERPEAVFKNAEFIPRLHRGLKELIFYLVDNDMMDFKTEKEMESIVTRFLAVE